MSDPATILDHIRHQFDSDIDDRGLPTAAGALQAILDEEGPEALVEAVLDAAQGDVCAVCGLPVDTTRSGTIRARGRWAHDVCVRHQAAKETDDYRP